MKNGAALAFLYCFKVVLSVTHKVRTTITLNLLSARISVVITLRCSTSRHVTSASQPITIHSCHSLCITLLHAISLVFRQPHPNYCSFITSSVHFITSSDSPYHQHHHLHVSIVDLHRSTVQCYYQWRRSVVKIGGGANSFFDPFSPSFTSPPLPIPSLRNRAS